MAALAASASDMESIEKLIASFNRLPGIGIKSAQRLAYHVISMPDEDVKSLADALIEAKQRVHFCPVCGSYTEDEICEICASPKRSSETLCVVKDARDVSFMERMREYNGRYHVLGGVLSPMDGVGPDKLRIAQLVERIKTEGVRRSFLPPIPMLKAKRPQAILPSSFAVCPCASPGSLTAFPSAAISNS